MSSARLIFEKKPEGAGRNRALKKMRYGVPREGGQCTHLTPEFLLRPEKTRCGDK